MLILTIRQLFPASAPDPKQRPYVDMYGTARRVMRDDAIFDMNVSQFQQLLRAAGKQSIFPARASIPDSPKYRSNKPIPYENGGVAVSGPLTRVLPQGNDEHERPDRFCISVDNITFIGGRSGSNSEVEAGKFIEFSSLDSSTNVYICICTSSTDSQG
jgi:hypothetical protein